MIVVDSSVWIDVIHGRSTPQTIKFFAVDNLNTSILGDIILLEILRGAQNDRHAANIHKKIEKFRPVSLLSPDLAMKAARNYRILRARGKTLSKTADLIIGTYCIEHGHSLLQADKDYLPMAEHLGLQLA